MGTGWRTGARSSGTLSSRPESAGGWRTAPVSWRWVNEDPCGTARTKKATDPFFFLTGPSSQARFDVQMDREHTDVEGSASGSPVEASPGTLANPRRRKRTLTVPSPQTRDNGLPPQPEGEGVQPGHDRTPGAEPSTAVYKDIVRASCKLYLDPKQFGDTEEGRAEWKKLKDQLYNAQREVVFMQNACTRMLWREDAGRLDNYVLTHGERPKTTGGWACGGTKKDWAEKPEEVRLKYAVPPPNVYQYAAPFAPTLTGAIRSNVARRTLQKWYTDRFEALIRCTKRPPHGRDTNPIPLRAQETEVKLGADGVFRIRVALVGGRNQDWWIELTPKDRFQRNLLTKIASGEWKRGDTLLQRDERGRWFFSIAYKRRIERRTVGGVAAVNRGIRVFLACVADDGDRWMYDGNDIIAYLKQIQLRRKEYQYDSKASGRSGHGRKRILRPIEHLSGKAERWRQTKCQTIARRLTEWLVRKKISTVLVENFSGIRQSDLGNDHLNQLLQEWPYYQLEMRLRACCDEAGIAVETMEPHYISQECPACGATGQDHVDLGNWKHRCPACDYREHLDVSAARVLLKRRSQPAEKVDDDGGKRRRRGRGGQKNGRRRSRS